MIKIGLKRNPDGTFSLLEDAEIIGEETIESQSQEEPQEEEIEEEVIEEVNESQEEITSLGKTKNKK